MSHTPAPWIVGVRTDWRYGDWPLFALRDMNDPNPDGEEVQADRRLIEAAPDLLEALEELLVAFGDVVAAADLDLTYNEKYAVEITEEAIAKAKGEER